jgi:lysophospholipase L1-like esterase
VRRRTLLFLAALTTAILVHGLALQPATARASELPCSVTWVDIYYTDDGDPPTYVDHTTPLGTYGLYECISRVYEFERDQAATDPHYGHQLYYSWGACSWPEVNGPNGPCGPPQTQPEPPPPIADNENSCGGGESGPGDQPCRYIALGDSYSAGEGVGNYYDGTADADDTCHRSRGSYAAVVARKLHFDDFDGEPGEGSAFAACSGAVSADAYRINPHNRSEPAQLKHLDATGDPNTISLITLTFGGNDMKFGPIVQDCTIIGIQHYLARRALELAPVLVNLPGNFSLAAAAQTTCRQKNKEMVDRLMRTVPGRLKNLYTAIRSKAPSAAIYVLGYPNFWPAHFDGEFCDFVLKGDVEYFSRRISEFDDKIAEAVASLNGSRIYYVSPGSWAGHTVCDGDNSWFIGLEGLPGLLRSFALGTNFATYKDVVQALYGEPAASVAMYYHPNALGQQALARALLRGR